jgi:hypothetical protein
MPVWRPAVSTMVAIPTWMIGVLAATALAVGGVAVGAMPSDPAAGGADERRERTAEERADRVSCGGQPHHHATIKRGRNGPGS